jgi:hypothetical protein
MLFDLFVEECGCLDGVARAVDCRTFLSRYHIPLDAVLLVNLSEFRLSHSVLGMLLIEELPSLFDRQFSISNETLSRCKLSEKLIGKSLSLWSPIVSTNVL